MVLEHFSICSICLAYLKYCNLLVWSIHSRSYGATDCHFATGCCVIQAGNQVLDTCQMGALALWSSSLALQAKDLTAICPAGLTIICILGNTCLQVYAVWVTGEGSCSQVSLASLVQPMSKLRSMAANGKASVPSSALKLASCSYMHSKGVAAPALSCSMLGQ